MEGLDSGKIALTTLFQNAKAELSRQQTTLKDVTVFIQRYLSTARLLMTSFVWSMTGPFRKKKGSRPYSLQCKSGSALHQDSKFPKIQFLGWIFLGHQGSRRRDIPEPGRGMSRTKTLCKAHFSVVL